MENLAIAIIVLTVVLALDLIGTIHNYIMARENRKKVETNKKNIKRNKRNITKHHE